MKCSYAFACKRKKNVWNLMHTTTSSFILQRRYRGRKNFSFQRRHLPSWSEKLFSVHFTRQIFVCLLFSITKVFIMSKIKPISPQAFFIDSVFYLCFNFITHFLNFFVFSNFAFVYFFLIFLRVFFVFLFFINIKKYLSVIL